MQSKPLVSVILPTYDRYAYLREAVESVMRQTYENWELIVVDDGSTDESPGWVGSLADPRVRLLALPHSGNLGQLRNRGIQHARGEFIAFLDSDDAFEPRKLEVQLAALQSKPECGWSYTAMTRVDREGREIHDPRIRTWREISGWILVPLLRFDALVDAPAVMVRRELLERVGLLDEALLESQDYELFFRLAAGSPAVAISEPLTRKRVHAGSLSSDRLRVHEAWIVIYDRFAAASSDPEVRRACAHEARRYRLSAAGRRGRDGNPGRALAHLLPVLRQRPWSIPAWRVLAASVILRGIVMPLGRRVRGALTSRRTLAER